MSLPRARIRSRGKAIVFGVSMYYKDQRKIVFQTLVNDVIASANRGHKNEAGGGGGDSVERLRSAV